MNFLGDISLQSRDAHLVPSTEETLFHDGKLFNYIILPSRSRFRPLNSFDKFDAASYPLRRIFGKRLTIGKKISEMQEIHKSYSAITGDVFTLKGISPQECRKKFAMRDPFPVSFHAKISHSFDVNLWPHEEWTDIRFTSLQPYSMIPSESILRKVYRHENIVNFQITLTSIVHDASLEDNDVWLIVRVGDHSKILVLGEMEHFSVLEFDWTISTPISIRTPHGGVFSLIVTQSSLFTCRENFFSNVKFCPP